MLRKSITKQKSQETFNKKKKGGKPIGINTINLATPNIWSCLKVEKQLIQFFAQIGRHVYLSLVGTKKCIQLDGQSNKAQIKSEKYLTIYQQQSIYSYLEHIAKSLFNWNCKKLSVVYFFRNDRYFKPKYPKVLFNNENWNSIIKNIKFLLNEQFYIEFISILQMVEQNYTTQEICENLIIKSQQLDQVPQIIQNFFILLNKEKRIEEQINGSSCTQLEKLKTIYLNSLENHKTYLYAIIEKLKYIMFDCCNTTQISLSQEYGNNDVYISSDYVDNNHYIQNDEEEEQFLIKNSY